MPSQPGASQNVGLNFPPNRYKRCSPVSPWKCERKRANYCRKATGDGRGKTQSDSNAKLMTVGLRPTRRSSCTRLSSGDVFGEATCLRRDTGERDADRLKRAVQIRVGATLIAKPDRIAIGNPDDAIAILEHQHPLQ